MSARDRILIPLRPAPDIPPPEAREFIEVLIQGFAAALIDELERARAKEKAS